VATDVQAMALGRQYHRVGDFTHAEEVFRPIVAADPANADAWHLLGRACLALGKLRDAEESYRQAEKLRPDSAEVHHNLGAVYFQQRRWGEALACFEQAVRLAPQTIASHINRGVVLGRLRRLDEAAACFREALRLQPDSADAHFNLGNVLRQTRRCDEAVASYREALRLKPDFAHAHNNLGNAFKDMGMLDEALPCFEAAVAAVPPDAAWHSNLLLTLQYRPDCTAQSLFEQHSRWAERHAAPLTPAARHSPPERDPRRLRIGYVSPDFRTHPVAFFIEPLLAAHDRRRFEIVCYADVERPDETTRRLQQYPDLWRSLVGMSDAQAAEQIRQDGVHILIDLAGHTADHRLLAFARRPAPVQATYLGYVATTGMAVMDYRITDARLDPPGRTERYYTEELIRLPEVAWCCRPPHGVEVGPSPAGEGKPLTFGSLHNLAKITPEVVALWSRVLAALPGSRMLLVAGVGPEADRRLLGLFARNGIEADRLMLVERKEYKEHFSVYHAIDVVLDAFPFCGCTTTCEALWMGVPVVTLAGDAYAGRQSLSILSHLGLTRLVAETPDAFVRAAVDLAENRTILAGLRSGLRERMRRSTLTDGPRFTSGLEQLYERMWRRFRQGPAPARRGAGPGGSEKHSAPAISQLFSLALERQEAGDLAEAERLFRQIVRTDPRHVDASHLLGLIALQTGRLEEAVSLFRQAVGLQPDFAEAHNNLGLALKKQGKLTEAEACFRQAIRLKAFLPETHCNLGLALALQGRLEEAEASFREAIRLKPDHAGAHSDLGNSLIEQGRLEEAEACYRQALRFQPGFAQAHHNFGCALSRAGKHQEALASYEEAIRCKPDYAEAHNSRGGTLLLLGDLAQGWAEQEWRWRCKNTLSPNLAIPPWDGAPLAGRTILLWSEQGLGDTLQFIRYAPQVKDRGGRVVVACQPGLTRLLATCPGVDEVVARTGAVTVRADLHAPLLSLPRLLGTTLATIPAPIPYLASDPALVEHWRAELASFREFKIGIVWQGNPSYAGDRQRSIPLSCFEPMARLPGVRLFSLQKGYGSEQLRQAAFPVTDLGPRLDETAGAFMDTAAVLQCVDLVVTSDTAVLHLAGALGARVWAALPYAPDWRWLLDRDDSPWYPTARLFRQTTPGDWAGVFQRIADAVRALLPKIGAAAPVSVHVRPGELIDRIAALEVECTRPIGALGLETRARLEAMRAACERGLPQSERLEQLSADLRAVHEKLWQCEEELRSCEARGDFGPRFIERTRDLCRGADSRAALMLQIDELCGL
jgi:predicted O-linked N-acetylglucosamine transferase (SPINDLY family)